MKEYVLRTMTILNKRTFVSKDTNETLYLLEVTIPFSESAIKSGALGLAVKQIYLPKDKWEQFNDDCINKVVEFTYGPNEYGSPVVTGWVFVDYLQRKE